MHKAFKFRLYPDKEQAELINKSIGCARYIFNYYLAERIKAYENEKKTLNYAACCKGLTQLKKDTPWLKEVDSMALQQSLKDLDKAYQKFFKEKKGFPKFKSKKNPRQSYRTNANKGSIQVNGSQVKLPRVGWINFARSREIEGQIISATVRRTPGGKYFMAIICDVEINPLPAAEKTVGIDLGIKHFAVMSDCKEEVGPKYYLQYEGRLKRLQRLLSCKQKGSSNRNKARIKVAKAHEKVRNCGLRLAG